MPGIGPVKEGSHEDSSKGHPHPQQYYPHLHPHWEVPAPAPAPAQDPWEHPDDIAATATAGAWGVGVSSLAGWLPKRPDSSPHHHHQHQDTPAGASGDKRSGRGVTSVGGKGEGLRGKKVMNPYEMTASRPPLSLARMMQQGRFEYLAEVNLGPGS